MVNFNGIRITNDLPRTSDDRGSKEYGTSKGGQFGCKDPDCPFVHPKPAFDFNHGPSHNTSPEDNSYTVFSPAEHQILLDNQANHHEAVASVTKLMKKKKKAEKKALKYVFGEDSIDETEGYDLEKNEIKILKHFFLLGRQFLIEKPNDIGTENDFEESFIVTVSAYRRGELEQFMIKAMKRVLENENRKDRDILNVIGTVMALSEFWFQREYQEYLDSEEKLAAAQPSEAQRQVEETREPLNDYLHSPEATLSSEKSMESRKSSTTPRQRTESEATLVQEIQNFRISSAKQQKIQNKKERAPIDTRGIKTVLSRLSNLIDGVDRLNVEFKSVEQDLHKALQELDSESCVADSPMSDTSSEQSVEESHNYENYFYL